MDLTTGIVDSVEYEGPVQFPAGIAQVRGFLVRPAEGSFANLGDGGAPVVNQNGKLVGMYVAGGISGVGVVAPIKPIRDKLGVKLVTAN